MAVSVAAPLGVAARVVATAERVLDLFLERLLDELADPQTHQLSDPVALANALAQLANPLARSLTRR